MAEWIGLESDVLLLIQEHLRFEQLTPFMRAFTTIGNHGELWIVCALGLLCNKKTRKAGTVILVTLLASYLFHNLFLKNVVQRPRPFDVIPGLKPLIPPPTDYSFPSGHTASSFAAAWVMRTMLPKRFGVPALLLAAVMGWTRLYLGVHYPSDVLAGAVSGMVVAGVIMRAVVPMLTMNKKGRKEN